MEDLTFKKIIKEMQLTALEERKERGDLSRWTSDTPWKETTPNCLWPIWDSNPEPLNCEQRKQIPILPSYYSLSI